ncbi:MAG: hypothetical protein GXY47_11810 [Acidobacteria bacterium]|jgi:phenylpyruvate tautomerase PptA (4-oxalocrotonate tautomerase family)|nr:hypothetical protein [Acidobacteriota bacterium]
MPVVIVEITPQEYAKKAEIARVFTEELSRITGIPKDPIVVLFHDISPENAAAAGEMLVERLRRAPSR